MKKPNLTKANINRILFWGRHLMADSSFRWTETDHRTMKLLAEEIRKIDHDNYLIQKGKKRGYVKYGRKIEDIR